MWRIRDVYPGSRILIFNLPGSRISDPGYKNSNKREGWKSFVVITFYVTTNLTKLHIILVLMCCRKKLGQFSKNYRIFYPKIFNKLSKIWIWDPESEIRDPEKTYSGSRIPKLGVKKAPDPGSGSATLPVFVLRVSSAHLKQSKYFNSSSFPTIPQILLHISAPLCRFKGSDQRENRRVWSNINTRYLVWGCGDGRYFVL